MKIFTSEVPIILENGLIFTNSFTASEYPKELENWLAKYYAYVHQDYKYIQYKQLQAVLDRKILILWEADKPLYPYYAFFFMLTENQNLIFIGDDIYQDGTKIGTADNNVDRIKFLVDLFYDKIDKTHLRWGNAEED